MLQVKTNIVFQHLAESKKRITVEQGGTRSGKTYNILKFFVIKLLREDGKVLTIVRESLPALKGSVMRDFFEILLEMGLYSESFHNKTENTYLLHGNLVEFVGIDQPHKIRGRKRDYLFINEANELNYDAWMQLTFRTEEKIVIDYNPSDEYHWLYDHVLTRDDAELFITTYKDNPFLSDDLVSEIERLQMADENYWRVYGLGQRGASSETIYTHWRYGEFPNDCEVCYGVDFGYNVASSVIKIGFDESNCYVQELLYETKLTTSDLIERLKELGIRRSDELFCDNAEPKTIEEMTRAGFNAKPAEKDVYAGIQKVKSVPLFITPESSNLLKEIKSYKWKLDKDGKIHPDEAPVKFNDHAMDAMRYGIYTKLNTPAFMVSVA